VLVPKMQEVNGQMVDVNQKVRDDFYERLTEFATCLKVALQSVTFYDDKSFTDADRRHYKETVKQMSSLRQLVKQDAGETIDYDEYAEQVRKLMDKHVVGVEVKEPDGVYEVGKMGKKADPKEWDENKTRNETDIIKTRVTKMIEQSLRDDPYAQEAFSKLLRKVIEEAEALFDHPLKQYMLFREFEEQVEKRALPEIPDRFSDNCHAQAYYGVFKKNLPEVFDIMQDEMHEKWIEMTFKVDEVVNTAVAEHSINPQNIEAAIRKELLPLIFRECKSIGAGMDQAKAIVEMIIQITRVGLNG
jgi:type I restriction enzyme R subunit